VARQRFANGSLFVSGKVNPSWVGRWREDVAFPEGIRRVQHSQVLGRLADMTEKQALRQLQSLVAKVNMVGFRPRVERTFADAVREWVNLVLPTLKPSTQSSTRSVLRQHLLPRLGHLKLHELDTLQLQRFVSGLSCESACGVRSEQSPLTSGNRGQRRPSAVSKHMTLAPFETGQSGHALSPNYGGKVRKLSGQVSTGSPRGDNLRPCPLSPKTQRNIVLALRSIVRSLRDWDYITEDAIRWDAVNRMLPKRVPPDVPVFTEEEVRRILAAAPEPYKTFYHLAAETGMRAGELCGLQWEDFDASHNVLRVRHGTWHGKLQSPKSPRASRCCRVSPGLAQGLLHLRGANTLRCARGSFMFGTRNGTPWDANLLVTRKLKPLLKKLGIPPAGLHAFRHYNATALDKANVPLKVRQERLGHADIRTTMQVYTHTDAGLDRWAAEELGKQLAGGGNA
jgi:integrase